MAHHCLHSQIDKLRTAFIRRTSANAVNGDIRGKVFEPFWQERYHFCKHALNLPRIRCQMLAPIIRLFRSPENLSDVM